LFPESLIFIPTYNVLHVRYWGEECIVYSEVSAETHLLEYPSGLLLESLILGPMTVKALAIKLAVEFSCESHEDIFSYVLTSTQTFRELGLLDVREPSA
jgi:PqqD family protein of HPr-rel-A system